jgi:ceramide glucosyltransferase
MIAHTLGWCLTGFALCSAGYALIVSWFVVRFGSPAGRSGASLPVTILKPLHYEEPDLSRTLATFLAQDYPAPVQIVFGVQDSTDPSIAIVRGLQRDHPRADIELVVDSRLHGSNRKVSNLIHMARVAKHDVVIVSDSDISVGRDWLAHVTAALAEPGVGAVSCLYAGKAGGNVWSSLAAMGTSCEFLPNVIAGLSFGLAAPCFGSTIALRRATLDAIGGFHAFANQLADDYEMGRAVRERGLKVAIPAFAVEHAGAERNWTDLYRHEVRWNRTTHAIDPAGHTLSFITHAVPLALFGAALSRFAIPADAVLAVTLVSRFCLKWSVERKFSIFAGPALALPLRDLLSFLIFLASFFGEDVHWRGSRFAVTQGGQLRSHEA